MVDFTCIYKLAVECNFFPTNMKSDDNGRVLMVDIWATT